MCYIKSPNSTLPPPYVSERPIAEPTTRPMYNASQKSFTAAKPVPAALFPSTLGGSPLQSHFISLIFFSFPSTLYLLAFLFVDSSLCGGSASNRFHFLRTNHFYFFISSFLFFLRLNLNFPLDLFTSLRIDIYCVFKSLYCLWF